MGRTLSVQMTAALQAVANGALWYYVWVDGGKPGTYPRGYAVLAEARRARYGVRHERVLAAPVAARVLGAYGPRPRRPVWCWCRVHSS